MTSDFVPVENQELSHKKRPCIKRALSGYNLFCQEKSSLPDFKKLSVKDRFTTLSKEWQHLSGEQRDAYNSKAKDRPQETIDVKRETKKSLEKMVSIIDHLQAMDDVEVVFVCSSSGEASSIVKTPFTQEDIEGHVGSRTFKLSSDITTEDALVRKYHRSSLTKKQQKDKEDDEKAVEDLQRLIRMKDEEVSQMKQAHQSRLSRLQSLQSAYNILKEQIETYEENERKPSKSKRINHRAAPKALQKENSDAVWNELTYYKQRTADLIQEKMNLQEELDQLRVQTSADAVTIEELKQCLREDKRELHIQMRRLKEVKKIEENERRKMKTLAQENDQLKATVSEVEERQDELKRRLEEASHETRILKAECTRLDSEATVTQSRAETLQSKVDRLKHSLIRMRKKNRLLVAEREETTSRKELDEKLNQTLDRMSQILTDGDEENTENNSQSDEEESPVKQRLSPKMVTSTPRKRYESHTRHVRSKTWTATSRELNSVQKHLTRMARAYEEDQVGEKIWKQVSTQTDGDRFGGLGITPKRFTNVGVGDLDINDETSTNASEDSRSDSPAVTSQVTGLTKPSLRLHPSPGIKSKSSVRNLQRRINTLQQQVTLLKEMKNTLQKTQEEMKANCERLEGDLNFASHQLQTSRQTVQRLSRELESNRTENALLKEQLTEIESKKTEEKKVMTSTKQMSDRLKTQSQEMGRQGSLIKTLREQNEEQAATIQTLQDKVKKLDKDSMQKRSLIEDLRGKAKSGELDKDSLKEQLEAEETASRRLKDEITNKKIEMESLKKQLIVAKKEKENYEHRWIHTKKDLEKQKSLTELSHSKQQEAEKSLNQLETLAAEQLQGLTQQSEDTLRAARKELKELRSRQREYNRAIMDLAVEVSKEIKKNPSKPPLMEKDDGLAAREQSLASSLLDLSAEDWQGFINDEEHQEADVEKGEKLTKEIDKLNKLLESKTFNSQRVLEMFRSSFLQRSR